MDDGFLPGIFLGVCFGILLGVGAGYGIGQREHHARNCITQFYHAKTSADSLLIVQDDKFCARVIEKTK